MHQKSIKLMVELALQRCQICFPAPPARLLASSIKGTDKLYDGTEHKEDGSDVEASLSDPSIICQPLQQPINSDA